MTLRGPIVSAAVNFSNNGYGRRSVGTGPAPAATTTPIRRTATDQVTLGATGLKLSRPRHGHRQQQCAIQTALGHEAFNSLVHYAYDQGITFFDTSQTYQTFSWMAAAIKDLPREKIFLQSKIPGKPGQILDVIDNHRKVFNTDYVDSMARIHCGWSRTTLDG